MQDAADFTCIFIAISQMYLTHSHTTTPLDAPGKQAF